MTCTPSFFFLLSDRRVIGIQEVKIDLEMPAQQLLSLWSLCKWKEKTKLQSLFSPLITASC